MKYAMTGYRGLIGQFLKERLDSEGGKCVLGIDKQDGFNVLDLALKEQYLDEKIDVFFHLAAQCRINEAIAMPRLPHSNNTNGIFEVLEFCRKHEIPKILVTSTSRVLSKERNPYVASKIYVEELTKAYKDCYGIDYIIVRPSTVYGPMFDTTSRLINNFIVAALRGEDLKIYGDNTKTLDFTYVDDFVEGIMLALKQPWNETYNVSGEDEVKLVDIAEEVIRAAESESNLLFFPQEIAQPQQVKIDNSKILNTGYVPKIKIKEGISKMIKWYKENPSAIERYVDRGAKYYDLNSKEQESK